MREQWSVKEVREILLHNPFVGDELALHLETTLPANWRRLIYRHGRPRVFNCIRLCMTIGGAKRELKDWLR